MEWAIILAVLALGLLILEIFVPGLVVGSIGAILLLMATYLTNEHKGPLAAMILFFGVASLAALAFYLLFQSTAARGLVLSQTVEGKAAGADPRLLGLSGRSLSALHPSGKALFILDGKEVHLDVVTSGEFLDKNQEIKVLQVDGNRIIVGSLIQV